MKPMLPFMICLLLLTGCWSNQEIDDTTNIYGVGLDKTDDSQDDMRFTVEIVKPGQGGNEDLPSAESADHMVLEETGDTLLSGSRDLIKYTKKRLNFGHTSTWIIGEELAKDNVTRPLDVLRRNLMLRLDGNLFITGDDPADIFNTPTLFEHLVASDLSASIQQTKFYAEYVPITLREFYKSLEGPVHNAYIPIIYVDENNEQEMTAINGTAVIKKDQMVGRLNNVETAGLNTLLNKVEGGSIEVDLNETDKISMNISDMETETIPSIKADQLEVTIQTNVTGTLADNMTSEKVNEHFLKTIEEHISKVVKHRIQSALDKLQQDLKTDITNIGPKTFRQHPQGWKKMESNWNETFANAAIDIKVETNVTHPGLINDNINRYRKPHHNPFFFLE